MAVCRRVADAGAGIAGSTPKCFCCFPWLVLATVILTPRRPPRESGNVTQSYDCSKRRVGRGGGEGGERGGRGKVLEKGAGQGVHDIAGCQIVHVGQIQSHPESVDLVAIFC